MEWEYWQLMTRDGYPISNMLSHEECEKLLSETFDNGYLYHIRKNIGQPPYMCRVGTF